MKPFNLEEAKAGKKVVTRDGREYKFGAHNPEAKEDHRLVGWIDNGLHTHYETGEFARLYGQSNNDLFMAEEEVWANVYRRVRSGSEEYFIAEWEDSEEKCKANAAFPKVADNYIKTIRLKP